MRDVSLLIALLCGTFGAGVLAWVSWPQRKIYRPIWTAVLVTSGMLTFCWVAFIWMWFSV